jgi:hypothetical protein
MWWQGKEFSADREADRESRAERGGLVALAVVVVPLVVVLAWLLLGWLGVLNNGLLPLRD